MASHQQRTEIRDGMRIDWDVPITMDDGLVLRADVFRPVKDGKYPVILSYGPYAKSLAFQDGYPSAGSVWRKASRRDRRVEQSLSKLGSGRSGKVGTARLHLRSCRLARRRMLAGFIDHFSPRETKDFYDCIEWAGVQPWSNGKSRAQWNFVLRHHQWQVASLQPPHLAAMCIWEGAATGTAI